MAGSEKTGGFDPNQANALLSAVALGDPDLVRRCIDAGADLDEQEQHWHGGQIYTTPLIRAVLDGHREIVELLLHAGADPNAPGAAYVEELTPMIAACKLGDVEVMQRLLDAGADPHQRTAGLNEHRRQVLHVAAEHGQVGAVRWLLGKNVKPSVKDSEKQTPLHCAAKEGHADVVRVLLEAGADPHAKAYDINKLTPRQAAERWKGLRYSDDRRPAPSKAGLREVIDLLGEAEKATPKRAKKQAKKKAAPVIEQRWKGAAYELPMPTFAEPCPQGAVDLLEEALGVEARTSDEVSNIHYFVAGEDTAKRVVDEQRDAIESLGCRVFIGNGPAGFQIHPDARVMLIPSTDLAEAIGLMQSNGANYEVGPGQVFAALRQLHELRPFVLSTIDYDLIEGRFTGRGGNSRALAKWMYTFCPDIVNQGVGSVAALATALTHGDRLYFWWD
ncbi:MAG: ankyrin repeat domain-containing protein [Planctomycetota bacterium]